MSDITTYGVHYLPPEEANNRGWNYLCGNPGGGSVDRYDVTCGACMELMREKGILPPPHVPPAMNSDDGIFRFHDRHHGFNYTMEVVPQLSGNVEITLEGSNGDGHIFTLSHLDRADLLRALLHDFHYSPERGGPHDDPNN